MNWTQLTELSMLDILIEESFNQDLLLFKHSTRCSISATALNRLQRNWQDAEMSHLKAVYLDLIRYRDISNAVAMRFGVEHQSPQVLLIRQGACIYENSHFGIDYREIRELTAQKNSMQS